MKAERTARLACVIALVVALACGAEAFLQQTQQPAGRARLAEGAGTAYNSSYFSFASFDDTSATQLYMNGGSAVNDLHDVLVLANGTSNAGSVYYLNPVDLDDDFTTTFNISVFSFTDGTGDAAPDGFTLIFQAESHDALGGLGAGLGYASATNNDTVGIVNSVAIEFDFHTDAEMNDPAYAHVSVHTRASDTVPNSADETYSLGMAELAYVATGLAQTHVVDVAHSASGQNLTISVDGVLLLTVDSFIMADAVLASAAYVGFTASEDSGNAAAYWVNSWMFDGVVGSYNSTLDDTVGSGDSDGDGDGSPSGITALGVFAVVGGLFLCLVLTCLVCITIFISSPDLRKSLSSMMNRNKAPQPYVPVSQDDDYTSALGIN